MTVYVFYHPEKIVEKFDWGPVTRTVKGQVFIYRPAFREWETALLSRWVIIEPDDVPKWCKAYILLMEGG